ncbi:MAG: hypothetical protein LUO81_03270, partial [Methanoregulaceae archaeon]|nr:hypothetical protein [Methanoregulaceae archaeon]
EELNNQGHGVGDSEQVVVRTVMNPGTVPVQILNSSVVTSVTTVLAPTTTKAGITFAPILAVLFLVLVIVLIEKS